MPVVRPLLISSVAILVGCTSAKPAVDSTKSPAVTIKAAPQAKGVWTRAVDYPTTTDTSVLATSAAADSCMRLARSHVRYANPADAPPDPPRAAGRWDSTRVVEGVLFSIEVPRVAVVAKTTDSGLTVSSFPDCGTNCRLGIRIFRDTSGGGLDAYISGLMKAEARIDSINKDPKAEAQEFNNYDGPPRPFTTPHGNGVYLDVDCGDCVTGSIFFGHRGQIADINYSFDYIPDGVRRACQLTRVAKTFRWKEP